MDPKLSQEQARKEQREQEQKDKTRLRGLDSLFATQVPKPPSDARLFSRQDRKKQEGNAIIKLRLSVSCRAERYTDGLLWGDRDAAEKTYDLSVEFSYDPSKKEWVARQHGSYFENDLFRKIGVHEIFNFCPVHFELKYSFRTD